jgi:hypothetical protein
VYALDSPLLLGLISLQFLKQAQHLRHEAEHNGQTETGFIIPKMLLPHDSAISEKSLHLLPSLKVGDSIKGRAGRTYTQPLINYAIRAVVKFPHLAGGTPAEVQKTRGIRLIPVTEIWPPLATEDFPGEYTVSTKSLTRIPFRRLFGEMSVSMDEPSVLRLIDGSPSASTLGCLRLTHCKHRTKAFGVHGTLGNSRKDSLLHDTAPECRAILC